MSPLQRRHPGRCPTGPLPDLRAFWGCPRQRGRFTPENLLLDAHGRVRIVDFGVAKLVGEDARDITLTVPGARVGTPHCMAPEQVEKSSDVDHRAYIYSLGVVLYELLTGELPLGRFAAPSAKTWLDARVDAVVLRALAKEREFRQQSADEVKSDVEGLGKVASEPPMPSTKSQSRWGNGRLLGITVLRPGTTGPKLDWPGLGTAWLGLAALLMPLGWGLIITQFGSMLAQRLLFTTGLVLGLVCPAVFSAHYRIRVFSGIPERSVEAVNFVIKQWAAQPDATSLRITEDPASPVPVPAPYLALVLSGWIALLLCMPALCLHQPHPVPPQRMFRMIVTISTLAVIVDATRRLLN